MSTRLTVFLMAAALCSAWAQSSDNQSCIPQEMEVLESKSDWMKGMFPPSPLLNDVVLPTYRGCKVSYNKHDSMTTFSSDDCRVLPKQFPLNTTGLTVKNCFMNVLRQGSFEQWYWLTYLDIRVNDNLKAVEAGTFRNLSALTNLSVSFNYNLFSLHRDSFQGLDSLLFLRLLKNGFTSLPTITPALRPQILPKLFFLDLQENPFNVIQATDFFPLQNSSVEVLCLELCSLSQIEPSSLSPLTNLAILKIGRNYLNTPQLVPLLKSLNKTAPRFQEINIQGNYVTLSPYELLATVASMNITQLHLQDNHVDSLYAGFFPKMPNLMVLDISGMTVSTIPPGTINGTLMPKLTKLFATQNQLNYVNPLNLPTLKVLDLSSNSDDSMLFKIVYNKPFSTTPNLEMLILASNTIYHLKIDMFGGLKALKVLVLRNCSVNKIDRFVFRDLQSLIFLDLGVNPMSTLDNPFQGDYLYGLDNLLVLRMDGCGLSNLSDPKMFKYVPRLHLLSLRDNSILTLDPNWFSFMPCLYKLDLSINSILYWADRLFEKCRGLKYLYLKSNQISDLSYNMLQDFETLEYLDFRENSLECTCELITLVNKFILPDNVTLENTNLGDTDNYCFTPRANPPIKVMDFLKDNLNNETCITSITTVAIIVSSVLSIVFIFAAMLYYFRWHLRYWIFRIRQSFGLAVFPGRKKAYGKNPQEYKYDAFVSYSSEDRNFVVRLVGMLENYPPHFSLCVFERDFDIGDLLSERIASSVEASRRTILVLTESFAKSQWCMWEMQLAQHRRIFYRGHETDPDPLIIVKLGDISEDCMTPTLRHLMKTRIYLEWSNDSKKQRLFWSKIRLALKSEPN